MSIVAITTVGSDAEVLEAHLAFHLNAGVDVVIADLSSASDAALETLERYEQAGFVRRASGSVTELARLAVAQHGAEWVVPIDSDEFWWPRGESLKDVLAVIPPRYAVVQALVRDFAGTSSSGESFAEKRTSRTSLLEDAGSEREPAARLLRSAYRASPSIEVDVDDWTRGGRLVPLRAWYPIEVLRFATPPAVHDAPLVSDTRLRDALRRLREEGGSGGTYALPIDGVARITFPVPTVVDDASYAIECAAVGEVDLVRLDEQIRQLEARIGALEATFWPRVRSAVRRLARRPG
jgi:hypothetical protein